MKVAEYRVASPESFMSHKYVQNPATLLYKCNKFINLFTYLGNDNWLTCPSNATL